MNQQTAWKRILQVLILSITILSMWCFHISSEAEAAQKPSLANRIGKIVIGETLKIELKNVPKGAKVTYRTKNASVATVSEDGEVTGVKDGKTKIVIKITNGTTKTKLRYKVKVKEPVISADSMSVALSESKKVTIKNQPTPAANAEYEWAIEDEEVAVIKDGVVTAKGPGETRVVVIISSDEFIYMLYQTIYVDAYTVTFDCDGGSEIEDQEIMAGGMVTIPSDPVLEGYVFMGWYSDYDYEEEYDFTAPVTEDHTIYAKWEEEDSKSYIVGFECYGGSYIAYQSVLKGEVPIEPDAPVLKGYTFAGWYLDEDLTEPYYFSKPLNERTTLYAKWEENPEEENQQDTYTVSFHYKDGRAVEYQMVEKGNIVKRPEDPVKEGYTFVGWYSDYKCTKEYDFSKPVKSDFSIYAKWEALKQQTDSEEKEEETNSESKEILPTTIAIPGIFYTQIFKGYSETYNTIVYPTNASNKELIWKSSDTSIATVDSNGTVTGVEYGSTTITVTAKSNPKVKIELSVEIIDITELSRGREILAREEALSFIKAQGIDRLSSDLEKIKAVHDYLILNAEYGFTEGDNPFEVSPVSYEAYGILVLKKGVCDSYRKAFQICMDILGIPCEGVSGDAVGNTDPEGHAWNVVTLDGERYHIDVTWDDPDSMIPYAQYGYFLLDDATMRLDHTWDSSVAPCTGTKYRMYPYEVEGLIAETETEAKEIIRRQYSKCTPSQYSMQVVVKENEITLHEIINYLWDELNVDITGWFVEYEVGDYHYYHVTAGYEE